MPPKKVNPASKSTQTPSTAPPVTNVPQHNFGQFFTVRPTDHIISEEHITSTTSTTPLVNVINSISDLPFGVSNIPNDPCGRRTVAKTDIPIGSTIMCERTPLWVVSVTSLEDFCHACALPISPQTALRDSSDLYSFCSEVCQREFKPIIEIEQPLLPYYSSYANTLNIDADLLRLAIRYLILKYLSIKNSASKNMSIIIPDAPTGWPEADPTKSRYITAQAHITHNVPIIKPTVHDISSLQVHAQHENDAGIIKTSQIVVQKLHPILRTFCSGMFLHVLYEAGPYDAKKDYYNELEADILAITGRINANIHSLQTYAFDNTNTPQSPCTSYEPPYQYGMGLYPIGAMFNHSCEPNCLFINQGPNLCIRTIQPISKGQELFVNYISLNTDIITRKYELLREKGFWCMCTRCTLQITEKTLLTKPVPTTIPAAAPSKGIKAPTKTVTTQPTVFAYNKTEICDEKVSRLLFDCFIANSYKKDVIDSIIRSNLLDFSLISVECGQIINISPKQRKIDEELLLSGYIQKNIKISTTVQMADALADQSERVDAAIQSAVKALRTGYEKSLISSPESDADIMSTLSTATFYTQLNQIYLGGLYFPAFNKLQGIFPNHIDEYEQTLNSNLTWHTTMLDKGNIVSYESWKVAYVTSLLNKVLNDLLDDTLSVVQGSDPFAKKQQAVEGFCTTIAHFHPISSLHHQRYQIIALLSNITTTTCPSLTSLAGMKFFLTTVMFVYKLMHYTTINAFPTLFLSFLEITKNIYIAEKQAENIITNNISGPNGTTIRLTQKAMQPMMQLIKNLAIKRAVSVVSATYGKKHPQAAYFTQWK